MQAPGPWERQMAYLPKRLDLVAARWLACVRVIAATALVVGEDDKLALDEELFLTVRHSAEALLRGIPKRGVSNVQMTQYTVSVPTPHSVPQDVNPAR